MDLISPLAAGVVGAENGTARLFRRGTSTRATVYTDFEASSADSSGDDIALDSTGGVVIYVNELVQVQVYSYLGELIRDFVAGEGAYAVEVISPAFTGTDYDSGQQGASRPTTAGSIFDLWLASAGAIDWEVLFSGSAKSLEEAFGSIYGLFYNVKSPEFGAVGDGSTDDTASWQATHDAAAAAGSGIVVAPPGTYNISSTLNWSAGVHLLCMPGRVMLRQVTAAAPHIAVSAALSNPTIVAGTDTYFIGCVLDSTVTNSATQFTVGHGTLNGIIIDSFRFCASAFCTGAGVVIGSSTGRTQIRNSEFVARAGTKLVYDTTSNSTTECVWIDNCDFTTPSGITYDETMVQSAINELRVTRSRFYYQASAGTSVGIYMSGNTYPLIVSGCSFRTLSGSSTNYGIRLYAAMRARVDASNYFSTSVTRYYQAADTDVADGTLSYLAMGSETTANNAGPLQTVTDGYWSYILTSTFVTAPATITMPKIYVTGQPLDFVIKNNSASDWSASTPGFTGIGNVGLAYDGNIPNLVIGHMTAARFVAMTVGAAIKWVQISGWPNAVAVF